MPDGLRPEEKSTLEQYTRTLCTDPMESTRFIRDFTSDLLNDAGELDWTYYRAYLYCDLETEAS